MSDSSWMRATPACRHSAVLAPFVTIQGCRSVVGRVLPVSAPDTQPRRRFLRIDADSGLSHHEPVWQVQAHAGEVRFCALSPTGEWLVTAGGDRAIKLWNVARREAEAFDGGTDPATAAAFTRDGRELLIGHGSGHVSRWNVETREKLWSDPGHSGAITQLAVSPDGQWFATSGRDRSVSLWKLTARTPQWSHSTVHPALSVAFSPDGRWLAVGTGERQQTATGAVRIHSVESGDTVAVLPEASDLAKSVAFSPDGAWLASRGSGGDLRLWDTPTWHPARRLPDSLAANRWLFVPSSSPLKNVAWTPRPIANQSGTDGRGVHPTVLQQATRDRIVAVDFIGIVKLWDSKLAAPPLRFRAHDGPINDVATSTHGESLFTVGRDGFLKQWNLDD